VAIPTDITGLWGWWKADVNGGLADNVGIASWPDQSGNARHLTQATGANQPTVQTNELNSLPIIRFDGASDYLNVPDPSALTAATVFLLIKIDADPPAATAQASLWHISSSGAESYFPWTDGNIYDTFGTPDRKSAGNPALSLASWRTYCISSSAGNWTNWVDGTQLFTTATNTVGFSSGATFGSGLSGGAFLDGDVAEFFIFNSALSTGDRQLMEAYITTKWFTSEWPPPGSGDSPAKLQVTHSGLVF
jgi:hypothetical protein